MPCPVSVKRRGGNTVFMPRIFTKLYYKYQTNLTQISKVVHVIPDVSFAHWPLLAKW